MSTTEATPKIPGTGVAVESSNRAQRREAARRSGLVRPEPRPAIDPVRVALAWHDIFARWDDRDKRPNGPVTL